MLQLHGSETPDRVPELKARYGLPVMKVLSIRDATDLAKSVPYLGIADRFLFDAKAPEGLGPAGRQRRRLRLAAAGCA
jgi:phosphoribosylanthranilate isomerase